MHIIYMHTYICIERVIMMKKTMCLKNIFDSRLYQFICKYHSKIPQYNNKLKNENQTVKKMRYFLD